MMTVITKTVASHVCLLMVPVKSAKTHFSVTCTSAKFNSNILLSNAICSSDQSSFVKTFVNNSLHLESTDIQLIRKSVFNIYI